MKNFDESRFLTIEGGAAALAPSVTAEIEQLLRAGAENVFFLGTGGAAILMQPAAILLKTDSKFRVFWEMAGELVQTGHAHLGSKSIVVIPSLSGTTKESVAAMTYCQRGGAKVIALVGHADTELGRSADKSFVNFAEDDTSCESLFLQSYFIALTILRVHDGRADAAQLIRELQTLPASLLEVKRGCETEADALALFMQHEPYIIITSAGNLWPEAHYYGMCILEEMQWIRTRPVHAADFFHGTLELLEKDVPLLALKGEDSARGLVERVEAFAKDYTSKLRALDSAEFALPGLSAAARALSSPIVLATVLERISSVLERRRNHPLTTRRYYKRVPY